MKKTALILLLIILCALAVGYWKSGYNYADSGRYTAGGASISDAVKDIEINWIDGRVSVAYHAGNEIMLSETSQKALSKKDELHWLLDGNELKVQYAAAGMRRMNGLNKSLTVLLPQSMRLEDVNITVVSGNMDVLDISAEQMKIVCVSGDADVKNVRVNELEANAVSGNVTLQFARTPDKIDVESVSGDVRIILPEDAGVTAEINSVSGRFGGSLSVESMKEKEYFSGDGHCSIDVDTVSGDIWLDELK